MDILLCETGNGGDFIFNNQDFKLTEGFSNQIYLALFGGNIGGEERDREDSPQSEERSDWFGNDVLFTDDLDFKFNSELETLLQKIALNSSSRLLIEETAKHDLSFMSDFGEIIVSATIEDIDKINIFVKVNEPGNSENKIFTYIWDATKNEASCLCGGYFKRPEVVPVGTNYAPSEYTPSEYEI